MREAITNAIKRNPPIYDAINRWRKPDGKLERWLEALAAHGPLTFIQVGASDGLRWDPLRKHIIKNRWSGVLVEPLPPVFDLLKQNYAYLASRQKLSFVNAALSNESGSDLTFWACSRDFLDHLSIDRALYWLRMSSLNREFIESKLAVLAKRPQPEKDVEPIDSPVITLAQVVQDKLNGKAPDLLFIDAEGHDDSVIYGHDFSLGSPLWIVYESHGLPLEKRQNLKAFLERKNYSVSDMDGDSVATLKNK